MGAFGFMLEEGMQGRASGPLTLLIRTILDLELFREMSSSYQV